MDVSALLILGAKAEERFAGIPFSLLDVLGQPVVRHQISVLQKQGIEKIAVVCEAEGDATIFCRAAQRCDVEWTNAEGPALWRACENAFSDLAHGGSEFVLALRLGPYSELGVEELVEFHLAQKARITAVRDSAGNGLDAFVISASRRNDAAFLFRHQLQQRRSESPDFVFNGYCSPLRHPADLRSLAIDSLEQRTGIVPAGREVRPGVWIGKHARIERGARLVAPVFIGARSRIRAAAVITRGTAVEHHTEVDCASVAENATLLPFTYLGAGLDVSHSIAGFRRLAHLRRDVEVEISDAKLLGQFAFSPAQRALLGAVDLTSFLPRQAARAVFDIFREKPAAAIPATATSHSGFPLVTSARGRETAAEAESSLETQPTEFPTPLIAARRYGNE